MKRLVVFDMDGTLADTSEGIINCHKHAHRVMGREEPEQETLLNIIGGPLLRTYETRFCFSKEDARKAVDAYRERYAQHGIHEAKLYDGIYELLHALKKRGCFLGVATLKAERFAKVMLAEMGVAEMFDIICGVDEKDSRTKAQLISMCMQHTGVCKEETVLVGDSEHDQKGALEAGVGFVGVTYGFGFSKAAAASSDILCGTPEAVFEEIEKRYLRGSQAEKYAE